MSESAGNAVGNVRKLLREMKTMRGIDLAPFYGDLIELQMDLQEVIKNTEDERFPFVQFPHIDRD